MIISNIHRMTLSGGSSCLDFINTGLEVNDIPVERLHVYDDLLILTKRLGLINESDLSCLRTKAKDYPEQAIRSLEDAKKLRESLYAIFETVANQDLSAIDKKHLTHYNSWRAKTLAAQEVKLHNNRLKLEWRKSDTPLLRPLWEFALSANELLLKGDLKYIRRCAGCDWLFYDQSKSHRRKWCDMQTCGSSAKAKRYYERTKTAKASRNKSDTV